MTMRHNVESLWPKIIRAQGELRAHPFLPLHGLRGLDKEFGLTPLVVDDPPSDFVAKVLAPAKLADLTATDLLELRRAIYAGISSDTLRPWAEKLLRFAEIKFPDTGVLPASLRQPAFTAALLASFFLDFCVATHDARYLNAALKLLDYQTARSWRCGAGPGLSRATAQALLCRNLLLAEHILRKQ